MRVFKDKNDFSWEIEVNISALKRVKSYLDLNLLDIFKQNQETQKFELLEKISEDPILLVDLLFVLCEKQVKERKMSTEDFANVFSGEVIENAVNSLLYEIIDFFPETKKAVLKKILDTGKKMQGEAEKLILEKLDNVNLEQMLKA